MNLRNELVEILINRDGASHHTFTCRSGLSLLIFYAAKIQIVFLKPIAAGLFFVLEDGRCVQFCDWRAVYLGDRPRDTWG